MYARVARYELQWDFLAKAEKTGISMKFLSNELLLCGH